MKTKITNAKILAFNPKTDDYDILTGEIYINDSIITGIYDSSSATSEGKDTSDFDKEIDACGNLIMPGFKDAHTHSAMTLFRSYADDLPLDKWLFDKIFPLEGNLTPDNVYWGSRLAILEYLSSGITSNFDMYMKNDANVKASVDSGFRTVLCGSINNFGGTVEDMENEYNNYNNTNELISYQLGFHAEYTTSREILEGMAALSHKYKAPVFTHNSETSKEVKECIERYGTTPTTFLNSLGMFDYGGGGYHCVYMSDEDLEIMKSKNLYAVTNPSSNLKLASGIAPTEKMSDMGINIAIGTDGAASNNCLDMFREMFLVTALQKVSLNDATAMDATKVIKMATYTGAHCMGLANCDDIRKGAKADLVMINLKRPNMQPINNIVKNLVYSGSKENVLMTMVNGKVLYENGNFNVGCDPEEIYAKANESIEQLKK